MGIIGMIKVEGNQSSGRVIVFFIRIIYMQG